MQPEAPTLDTATAGEHPEIAPPELRVRKIALAGKGGTGKTTLSGTLARAIAQRRPGRAVWAIDADSNPNLGLTLGLPRETVAGLDPLPRSLLEERHDEAGKRSLHLAMPPLEVARRHGTQAPDGVTLMLMGTVGHAGAG